MNKLKVFITRKWPASVETRLKQHYDVTLNSDRLIRSKQWQGWCPTHMLSSNVTGATLGLIGALGVSLKQWRAKRTTALI